MPTDAKAGCLYPNKRPHPARGEVARVSTTPSSPTCWANVAETATANIFMVKDGAVHTPIANGTFLNGITRQRVISLLRDAGETVLESVLRYEHFLQADEIFTTGNYMKVMPVTRIDDLTLQPGPIFKKARELYWDFAHARH